MTDAPIVDEKSAAIFIVCLFYAVHLVEEFSLGFVEWADRYFGRFDWKQNLLGNSIFFVFVVAACWGHYENQARYLWAGMSVIMWILANSFIHISCTMLGREYSPGVVTAAGIYVPGGVYFLVKWNGLGLLSWSDIILSFLVGAILFMLLPTFARAVYFHAQLARIFHLVRWVTVNIGRSLKLTIASFLGICMWLWLKSGYFLKTINEIEFQIARPKPAGPSLCKTKTWIEKLSRSFFNRLGSHLSPISDINCIDPPVKDRAVGTFFAKSPQDLNVPPWNYIACFLRAL